MNTILLIIMLAALALLAFIITRFRREEVCNAKAPVPDPDPASTQPAQDPDPNPIQTAAIEEVAAMTPTAAPKGIKEEEIAAKVAVGLTRDQAIQVINNQLAEDAAAAKAAKKKA